MKKVTVTIVLITITLFTAKAQDNQPAKKTTGSTKSIYTKKRYNDSVDRVNELYALANEYVQKKANLEAGEKERHHIEEFHIGRTKDEKIEQERQSDININPLKLRLGELKNEIEQKENEYKEIYKKN